MSNQLTTTNQNAKLALEKSKSLLEITSKILVTKKSTPSPKVGRISDDQIRAIEFEDQIDAWIDKDTGLMWEVKTKENIEHSYVWSKEEIEKVVFPKELTDDIKDAFSYAQKLNTNNHAGFSDWRVPTIEELKTLVTEEENNSNCIKYPLSKNNAVASYYWSSTTYAYYASGAWFVSFNYDYQSGSYKINSSHVRCVRAGQ